MSRNSPFRGSERNGTEGIPRKKRLGGTGEEGGVVVPIAHQPGQTVVQGRLSLNVCAHHFIFRGMVWIEITKFRVICFFKKWFGTAFRTFLSSAEWFGTEFRAFFVPRNRRNSDGINPNFRLFRVPRNIFFSENGNPRHSTSGLIIG